jgi:hypothetical protein
MPPPRLKKSLLCFCCTWTEHGLLCGLHDLPPPPRDAAQGWQLPTAHVSYSTLCLLLRYGTSVGRVCWARAVESRAGGSVLWSPRAPHPPILTHISVCNVRHPSLIDLCPPCPAELPESNDG